MAWAAYLTGYRGLKARPRSPSQRERERRRRQQSTPRAARLNRARHGSYGNNGIDTSCCGGGGGGAALLPTALRGCEQQLLRPTVAAAAAVSHGSRCIAPARRGPRRGSSPSSLASWDSARLGLEPGPSRVRKFMMPAAGEENFAPRTESSAKMTGSRMAFASRG